MIYYYLPRSFGSTIFVLLLACLIFGPIVVIYVLFSGQLWFRPWPDMRNVIVISGQYGDASGINYSLGREEGDQVYINGLPPKNTKTALMAFYLGHSLNSPDVLLEGDKIIIYPKFSVSDVRQPLWILNISPKCVVVDHYKVKPFKDGELNHYIGTADLQLKDISIPDASSDPAQAQFPSATVTSIYFYPDPREILRRRQAGFNYLAYGLIASLLGIYYFYGPRSGWLKWREGLTLSGDDAISES